MPLDFEIDDLDGSADVFSSDMDVDVDCDSDIDTELFADLDFDALGIDPLCPTAAKPGSEEKVIMLAARYAAGVPLWHDNDCYDHGPRQKMADLN